MPDSSPRSAVAIDLEPACGELMRRANCDRKEACGVVRMLLDAGGNAEMEIDGVRHLLSVRVKLGHTQLVECLPLRPTR